MVRNFYYDDEDENEYPRMVAESKPTYGTVRTPIVSSEKSTYKPSYIPPTPSVTPAAKKPVIKVDTSVIKAGTLVKHKAYGVGQVKGIDGGIIVVTINGADKKFQFPGAFEQDFLSLDVE